jgi:gamma-glutamyltranspeptidase/glutathione hydrolase/leukotriene-C4 hydrolase
VKDDGTLVTEGDLLVNQKLGTTFRRIAADPMTFYTGSLAQDIVDDIKEYGWRN